MWGRKSVYGKNVHDTKQGEKPFIYPPNSEKPFVKKAKKENKKENKKDVTDKKTTSFEDEYLKFIEDLKKQSEK